VYPKSGLLTIVRQAFASKTTRKNTQKRAKKPSYTPIFTILCHSGTYKKPGVRQEFSPA
jgi:hypothetical protein